MKKLLIATAAVACFSANAAEEDINPWKHCGIGALIFDDNGTAAALSNIIWDLGTTAVSSQISSESSCEGNRTKTAMFIQDNFKQVMEQTTEGEGKHIDAMLEMLEVDSEKRETIIANLRAKISADTQPEGYYNLLVAAI
jgi:hypothetical protein